MSKNLESMPSWPQVEAAQEAITRHRQPDGDKATLTAAQKALGDAYEACRAELAGGESNESEPTAPKSDGDEAGTDGESDALEPTKLADPDAEITKVDKPPSVPTKLAKPTKKRPSRGNK